MAQSKPLPRGIDMPWPGRYRARISNDGTQYLLGIFDSLTDARAALDIARGQKARGTFVPPPRLRRERRAARRRAELEALTLRQWVPIWLAQLEDTGRRPATLATYRSVMDAHVLPALGDTGLRQLTPAEIDVWLSDLRKIPASRYAGAKGNGVATNAARTLRTCLNSAVRAGHLDASPFRAPIPRAGRVRPGDAHDDVATPAEVAAMAAAMPPHLAIAVPLAAWCQLRLGEVLGLQRGDLLHLEDPAHATLRVRRQLNSKTSPPSLTPPKSDAGRRDVAIPAALLPDLRAHLDAHAAPGPAGPVITSPGGAGGYVSQSAFDRYWRAARVAGGRPLLRFHDLRHTGLTVFAQAGATAAELMHRGGHSSLDVALRYQHATAERDRALAARLSQAIAPDVDTGEPTPPGVAPLRRRASRPSTVREAR